MSGWSIFDFDGVITSRDSMTVLCRKAIRRRPLAVVRVLALLALRSMLRTPAGRQRVDATIVAVALLGVRADDYSTLAADTVRQFAEFGWVRHSLVDALIEAREHGPVIVATASERELVERFLAAIDVAGIEVLGSTLTSDSHGLRFSWHNVGEQKLHSLLERGIPLQHATFYTDSLNDLPVAEACLTTLYVGSDKRAADRLVHASFTVGPTRTLRAGE
ncbi:HAD family hydrolase [Curtobacterium sp. NPDC089689]|uniref:HAD family hydrolase n=1 Tax=Curtobacterium sp. NPDC089689 TaxID=3363968 RepID=UPI003814BB60